MPKPPTLPNEGWNYDVIVTKRDGRFYLRIPELNLIVEDRDIAEGYADLEAARRALIQHHTTIGATVPPPRDIVVRRALVERTMPFLFKTAAVAVVGSVLIIATAVAANYAMRDPLRHAAQKATRAAVLQITAGIEDAARRDLTPDREERLRVALRNVVPVLRPFIEELQPLFGDRSPP